MKYLKVNTNLAETLTSIEEKQAMHDDYAKLVLADPQVLANIVKVIVPEFRSYSIDKIIPCIGETVVSLRLPEKLCIRIESVGTEDIDADDGKIVYDIRFPLYYNNRTIKFLVNVDAQRSTSNNKLGYHIESRIAYYMARMVSSQKNVEFIKSNYDELKDIYSIWICMDTQDGEDSIIELGIQPKLLYGKSNWMPKRSIMNGAIIRIRDSKDREESKNKLIAMLEVLLSSTKKKEKMQQLEGYGLKMTTELEGCVSDMCNISEAILERALEEGLEKGIEQGLEKGIEQGIEQGLEQGIEKGIEQGIEKNQLDNIVKLMKKLSLTEEEAMDMLDIAKENRIRYHDILKK